MENSIYEDEFEEFRVRANSGGTLPETWRRKREEVRRRRRRAGNHCRCPWPSRESSFSDGEEEVMDSLRESFHSLRVSIEEEPEVEDMYDPCSMRGGRPHSLPCTNKLPRRADRYDLPMEHSYTSGYPYETPLARNSIPDGVHRPRSSTMPSGKLNHGNGTHRRQGNRQTPDLCRVCSFKITSKGIVKSKDTVIKSEENLSSSGSPKTQVPSSPVGNGSLTSLASSGSGGSGSEPYTVTVLGAPDSGKTSLIQQFSVSGYSEVPNISIDETSEQRILVSLDGESSMLEFSQSRHLDQTLQYPPDAFVVVFSVVESYTFQIANQILHRIQHGPCRNSIVILVANKLDLVRSRVVSHHEGKALAAAYGCKYAEVSTVLRHQVDELLVGVLKQIRLSAHSRAKREAERRRLAREQIGDKLCCLKKHSMLGRILTSKLESKSCDNLLVL